MFGPGCLSYLLFFLLAAEQVSEEVERALAKLGPTKLNGRYIFCSLSLFNYIGAPKWVEFDELA